MKGKFTVYPVGKGKPTKKGKREYYFLIGDVDKETGLMGGGTHGFNAWSSFDFELQFMKPVEAILDMNQYGAEMVIRVKELIGLKGEFDEDEGVAERKF